MGPAEKDIIEQACRLRKPLPKKIADAPELDLGLEFVYSAFWQLSSCRSTGWGIGPIPWRDIAEYARMHELDSDETEDFVYLVRAMDSAYLKHHAVKKPETPAPA